MPSPRVYEPEPPSATPIYDALYAEFRRLFRALPGDRSGEDDLYFTGFGQQSATTTGTTGNGYAGNGYAGNEYAASATPGRHRGYLALPPGRG